MEFLTPVMIVFIIFVMFPGVVLHYRTLQKKSGGINAEDQEKLEELWRQADSMAERIKTLESILDVEARDWREKYDG